MPWGAFEDLHNGISQVEEEVEPDEDVDDDVCLLLQGCHEHADIEQEDRQFGEEDQRTVCDLGDVGYLHRLC